MASGGVGSLDDLLELQYIKVHATIIGSALYEGKIKLLELKPLTI